MNDFAQIEEKMAHLEVGDLVTMTIVDVFETDNNGKLLSYCPTFDNRDIRKTTQASEMVRKSSSRFISQLGVIANSQAAAKLNQGVAAVTKLGFSAAKSMAEQVKHSMDERLMNSPSRSTASSKNAQSSMNAQGFETALNMAENAATASDQNTSRRSDLYVSDDSTGAGEETSFELAERT
jgi:hypothetical protein